jgi:triacylglycerol lipase
MNSSKPSVILVHGLGRLPTSLWTIERTLRLQDYPVSNWGYTSLRNTLTESASQLQKAYTTVAQTTDRVDFVTHSMGGLVVRRLLALSVLPKLGKIVMIAPPNNGSVVAQRLLENPLAQSILGPAAMELCDADYLHKICAVPTTPVMIIAGTKARDLRNPVSLFSQSFLQEPHDGTVTVRETKLPNMDRFVEVPDCHTWLVNHPQTLREITTFLQG